MTFRKQDSMLKLLGSYICLRSSVNHWRKSLSRQSVINVIKPCGVGECKPLTQTLRQYHIRATQLHLPSYTHTFVGHCKNVSLGLDRDCHGFYSHNVVLQNQYATQSKYEDISLKDAKVQDYLSTLLAEYRDLETELTRESNQTAKKQRLLQRRKIEMMPLVERIEEWEQKNLDLEEIHNLLKDCNENELRELAEEELRQCNEDLDQIESEILALLVPVDDTDDMDDIIVELTAGVGGQEAMLFTNDVFSMYQRYAAYRGWRFDILDMSDSDIGGMRRATINMSGSEVYKYMKYEGGVHRVQRVPKTERQGRVHTSTMTVAVLPHPKEIDLSLDPGDLKIETKRASGAGGQHVNKTESAVRIVHLPTGIAAECQQERSQIKNREIAMKMLEAKIYNKQLEKQQSQERQSRKLQVGTSARSEKIRTYNFNQDRITDHRIGVSTFNVEGFLAGEDDLDEMVQSLQHYDKIEALRELIENNAEKSAE